MKKIVTIILCLLGVLCASASPIHVSASMNYSSSYKGAERSGFVHSTSHIHHAASGLAQVPMTSMSSTSRSMGTMPAYANPVMGNTMSVSTGIYTSASYISGGVTSGETYARMSGPRRTGGITPPDTPDCFCEDKNGDGKCDHCGADYHEGEEFDSGCGNNPCWCPIGNTPWLIISALAIAFAIYKRKQSIS